MIRLITFEGGDGSGKTTQLKLLQSYLAGRGRACLVTQEPGATTLGQTLRRVLVNSGQGEITIHAELFLYLADRAQHIREVIVPALKEGVLVLCDRFTDSTLAYQGYGRGVDLLLLDRMNELASEGVKPDLTLLLDCEPEVGLARAHRRAAVAPSGAAAADRFENESLEFHRRVRHGFLKLARSDPKRFEVLDSSAPERVIHDKIKAIVNRRLGS